MNGEILPPLTATLHVKPKGWAVGLNLWLPLFLVWLLLLPLLILLLPLLFVAALILGLDLWRSLKAVATLLAATRGTRVEVHRSEAKVLFHLH